MAELDQQLRTTTTTATNSNGDPENPPEDSIDFTLLRLDSFNSSSKATSTSTNTTNYRTPCATCGCSGLSALPTNTISCSSNKRRSPDSTAPTLDPQDQLPKKPKKLFLEPVDNTTSSTVAGDFAKIILPCATSPHHSLPVLRRCYSDPYTPPVHGSDSLSESGQRFAPNLAPHSPPESSKIAAATAVTPASKETASLPPRPPVLRRTVSDPSPNKSFSRTSTSNDEIVDEYKWLRRMRDRMKEVNQLWDEFLPDEEEEENKGTEDKTANETKAGLVKECEEAICVERTGEGLIIRFKCPCGKGYQILLSGRNCYYKLM